ncbi:MAG: glycosyltransferase family 2 protein [Candidatus Woesearchaeota archaeon]
MFGVTEIIQGIIYFISLYYVIFWLLVLLDSDKERKKVLNKYPEVSIIIPAYNEEENIIKTIRSIQSLDYPKNKLSLIVVDDGSKDKTYELCKDYCSKIKDFSKVIVLSQKNSGKHAAINRALDFVKTDFFAILDADSFPAKDSLKNIIAHYDDDKIAVITPIIKVYKPKNTIEVIQWFEYSVNHFYKSLISKLNSLHVAPGPLSVYRTSIVKKIGGFRKAHNTEDMEIAMRIQKYNYKIVQCNDAFVYTRTPSDVKSLYKQRVRWNYGTFKNLIDYKKMLFNKKYGDFGIFQLPIILLSGILGITILFLILYDFLKGLKPTFNMLKLYKFNIIEYFKNSQFNIILLDIDIRALITFFVFFIITFFVILKSLKLQRNKYSFKKSGQFLLYLFYYYIFLAIVWLSVFGKQLMGKKNKWSK